MKIIYIISILLITTLSSCSEFNNSIHAEDNNIPLPDGNETYLPVFPQIDQPRPKIINSSFTIDLENSKDGNINKALYEFEKVYDEQSNIQVTGYLKDIENTNTNLGLNETYKNLIGNVYYEKNQSIKGHFFGSLVDNNLNKEFIFKERSFSEVKENNEITASVKDFGNSVEISNKINKKEDLFYSTITANFNNSGKIISGKIITNNNPTINFYLKKEGAKIKEITITDELETIGNLALTYDDKNNPFSLILANNYKSNKILSNMIISGLYSNSTLDKEQNALQIAFELMKLCDFSSNNITTATWNDIEVLNYEYQYNSKNYPTKIKKSQSYANDFDFINQLGYNVKTLNGTTTITYH